MKINPLKLKDLEEIGSAEKEFDCEVRLSHCSSLFESVRAKTLEDAIGYLKKAHPEALSIREADHWQ